ncbi:MAG: hypothetical protein A3C44_06550 [Gammaproteobacteria bacterium RIFCSPHIGHO2_02_FULL_39_13]|nr:MAG: hypothetical protein A3C44_06550 [Gammaproteobacteria bacterium RIFCSPHIGHO2_02_FULL_39_13]OGT49765.1 MAG: hypothetical protein A3E53_04685 [Gammaproteobacteria bacterium RIFCSPHIGHO2_12_FULL_39_24]
MINAKKIFIVAGLIISADFTMSIFANNPAQSCLPFLQHYQDPGYLSTPASALPTLQQCAKKLSCNDSVLSSIDNCSEKLANLYTASIANDAAAKAQAAVPPAPPGFPGSGKMGSEQQHIPAVTKETPKTTDSTDSGKSINWF